MRLQALWGTSVTARAMAVMITATTIRATTTIGDGTVAVTETIERPKLKARQKLSK